MQDGNHYEMLVGIFRMGRPSHRVYQSNGAHKDLALNDAMIFSHLASDTSHFYSSLSPK